MELADHQLHLTQLTQQREELEDSISQNQNLLLRVKGAIEYLNTIGVTLTESESVEEVVEEKEVEVVED